MKKKAAATKSSSRPAQSEAAKERVRRHLAGLSPLSLDPSEAAGAAFVSPQERARIRYAEHKKKKEAAMARANQKKAAAQPTNPRRKPRSG